MSAVGYVSTTGDSRKVSKTGDTMTGDLVLADDVPDVTHSAASKGYVDGRLPSAAVVLVAAPTGVAATDQAAINTAITTLSGLGTPGVVQLQAGTYVVPAPGSAANGCVSMTVNNSMLRGMGMGVTTIQLSSGTTGVTGIVRTPSGVANSKITFRDFSIDGNSAGQSGAPVVIGFYCGVTPNATSTDTDIRCESIEIYGCTGYGFDPHERTTRPVFNHCISHNNGTSGSHDGFTLDACYDFELIDCVSYSNGRHGFNFVTASNRGKITGCHAYSNGSNGFTVQNGSKYLQFSNCMSYNNTSAGYVVNGVAQSGQQDNTIGGMHTFTGCQALTSGTHGFQLVGNSYSTLIGCRSQDASQTTTNTSNHYQIDESGSAFSTNNTLSGCTWAQTSGVTNAAKYGISEKTSSDGPTYVIGCSGSGTATGSLNLLNATSLLVAAHNGSSGGHPATFAYADEVPSEHGLVEWNGPAKYGNVTTTIGTAGVGNFAKLITQSGSSFSTVNLNVRTIGSTLTNAYIGVYSSDGSTLLASTTADQSATLVSPTGNKAFALNTSVSVAAGTTLFIAVLVGSATTMPTFAGFSASGAALPNLGLGTSFSTPARFGTFGSGLTALPSTLTIAGSSATTFWVGLS